MNPMTPVFMDPPAKFGSANDAAWLPTMDALKERPGEWAVICEATYSTTGNLAARIKARRGVWAEGRFEVTTRKVPDSRPEIVRVFARYMPAASPDPSAAYKAALEDQITDENES